MTLENATARAIDGRQTWALVSLGAALVFLTGYTATVANVPTVDRYVIAVLLCGGVYLAALWLTVFARRSDPGEAARPLAAPGDLTTTLWIILAVAVLLRVIAFSAPHDGLTTDAYRYVWDGRIQWAGFSPYDQVPAAPELEELRDPDIYPRINQKERAVTIYPPMAQILFAVGNQLSDSVTGIKAVMKMADLATIIALLLLLKAARMPLERVIIYAWHPLPLWELVSQAHIDAAAIALLVGGLAAVWHQRQGLAGGLLAAGVLVKYFPLALVPALWQRWDWRMPLGFLVVTAVLVAPYWWVSSGNLSGYLGQHLDNEGYKSGWGFHGIWLWRDVGFTGFASEVWIGASVLVLVALAALSFWGRPAAAAEPWQLVLIASAFVWLTSPHYPWYFVWIVPLLCLYASPAALAMTLASPILYWPRPPGGATWTEIYLVVYYLPLMVLAVELYLRSARANATSETVPSKPR